MGSGYLSTICFSLFMYGSYCNYERELESLNGDETQNLVEMIQSVINREMLECSLLILHQNQPVIERLIPAILRTSPHGVSTINSEQLMGSEIKELMNAKESKDPLSCTNYLVLFENETSTRPLIDAGTSFWKGYQKRLFVALKKNDYDALRAFLLNPVFRKSAQLSYISRVKYGWKSGMLSLFKGPFEQSLRQLSSWFSNVQLIKNEVTLFPQNKFDDLEGFNFSITSKNISMFVKVNDVTKPGPGRFTGIEIEILEALSASANMTYFFVEPPDGQFGYLKPNTTQWTGMIGQVQREDVHLAMCFISQTYPRSLYVDFTAMLYKEKAELVTPAPTSLPQWEGPIRPFTSPVWIATAVIFVAVSFVLLIIAWISVEKVGNDEWFKSFANCCLFCLLPLLMQGYPKDYQRNSGRVFVAFWLFAAMLISIYYSSSLVSFLVEPGMREPIKSLEELANSDIRLQMMSSGGTDSQMLESSENPAIRALVNRRTYNPSYVENLKAVALTGKVATWLSSMQGKMTVAVYYSDKYGNPLVYFTGESLATEAVIWPLQKHAPYKQRFDKAIAGLTEGGIVNRILTGRMISEIQTNRKKKEMENKKAGKAEDAAVEMSPPTQITLKLVHFQGPFMMLGFGCVFGLLVLLIELLVYKNLQKYPIQPNK